MCSRKRAVNHDASGKINRNATNHAVVPRLRALSGRVFTDQYIFHHVVADRGSNPQTTKPVQSMSMQRHVFPVLLMSTIAIVSAQAEPLSLTPHRYAQDR